LSEITSAVIGLIIVHIGAGVDEHDTRSANLRRSSIQQLTPSRCGWEIFNSVIITKNSISFA